MGSDLNPLWFPSFFPFMLIAVAVHASKGGSIGEPYSLFYGFLVLISCTVRASNADYLAFSSCGLCAQLSS